MKRKYLFLTIILTLVLGLFASTAETPEEMGYVIEETVEVESWMTTSFTNSIEEPLEVEDWMTVPFTIN